MLIKMFISADDGALLFGCVFLDFSAYHDRAPFFLSPSLFVSA